MLYWNVSCTIYLFYSFSDVQYEDHDLSPANLCSSPVKTRSKRKRNSSTIKKICADTTNNVDMAINNSSSRKRSARSSKRK